MRRAILIFAALMVCAMAAAPARRAQDASRVAAAAATIAAANTVDATPAEKLENLELQRRMAGSSEDMARIGLWQLWLTAGTIIGLGVTLWMTRVSLSQTREAMGDAKREAIKGLRAYLGIDPVEVVDFVAGRPLTVRARICNYGQTPGEFIQLHARLLVFDSIDDVSVPDPTPEDYKPIPDLAPQMDLWAPIVSDAALTRRQTRALTAGTAVAVVVVVVHFGNVFGRRHYRRLVQLRNGPGLKAIQHMVSPHPRHDPPWN